MGNYHSQAYSFGTWVNAISQNILVGFSQKAYNFVSSTRGVQPSFPRILSDTSCFSKYCPNCTVAFLPMLFCMLLFLLLLFSILLFCIVAFQHSPLYKPIKNNLDATPLCWHGLTSKKCSMADTTIFSHGTDSYFTV